MNIEIHSMAAEGIAFILPAVAVSWEDRRLRGCLISWLVWTVAIEFRGREI